MNLNESVRNICDELKNVLLLAGSRNELGVPVFTVTCHAIFPQGQTKVELLSSLFLMRSNC